MTTADQLQSERATFNQEVARAVRCVESDSLMYATVHLDNARIALENLKVLKGEVKS